MKTQTKREREKKVVSEMIGLYCRRKHGFPKGELCPQCRELEQYAWQRSEKCPFMETKTFCSNCTVHCYKPEMRERIREVMRFSGPRMIFSHPVMAIRHLVDSKTEQKRNRKTGCVTASRTGIFLRSSTHLSWRRTVSTMMRSNIPMRPSAGVQRVRRRILNWSRV